MSKLNKFKSRIEADDSLEITYLGRPLSSEVKMDVYQCFWKTKRLTNKELKLYRIVFGLLLKA